MSLQDAIHNITEGSSNAPTRTEILKGAATELPSASVAFAQEIYQHPAQAAGHAVKTLAESAAMGAAIGYLVPARGPAAMIVAGAFTIPMVVKAYNRVEDAHDQAISGKNIQAVEKDLAKDTVAGGYDLGLSLAGGIGGTELGVRAATSRTAFGALGQASQRAIMQGENIALSAFSNKSGHSLSALDAVSAASKSVESKSIIAGQTPPTAAEIAAVKVPGDAGTTSLGITEKTGLAARLAQHNIVNPKLDRFLEAGGDSQMYFGSLHGHSRYSDGMGLPKDLYNKAIAEGQQVTTITDHNHLAARDGVSPGDPRTPDQAQSPIIAANPIEYSQTFADAAATTTDGKHVSLVGTELGTIGHVGSEHGHGGGGDKGGKGGSKGGGKGKPEEAGIMAHADEEGHGHSHGDEEFFDNAQGHTHGMMNPESIGEHNPGNKPFDLAQARAESNAAAHIGGVNHANLLEVPTFFEAVRQPKPGMVASVMRAFGREPEPVVKAPDVVKYNDGDYKALVDHLDQLKATDGGSPIIQLNHPRYLADENPNTPAELRGRDYGQKSFKNQQEWLDRFATPYVRQIELIKGGALNPNPVDKVPMGSLDPTSFAGYIDKGVHASPTFGRDFHFGDPVGNPGATGIYARSLDKPGILNALRERRTIATTSSKNLSGVLTGNDQFVMGAILDHSVVPSLALKMRIDGNVDPNASYTLKLWGDSNVGDGKLAEVVQTKQVKGSDLLSADQTVAFDPVKGTTGQNSAYYVEVNRTDGLGNDDRMWTAPIWLENLAGNKHTMLSKFIAGQASQTMPNPFQSKIGITPTPVGITPSITR